MPESKSESSGRRLLIGCWEDTQPESLTVNRLRVRLMHWEWRVYLFTSPVIGTPQSHSRQLSIHISMERRPWSGGTGRAYMPDIGLSSAALTRAKPSGDGKPTPGPGATKTTAATFTNTRTE